MASSSFSQHFLALVDVKLNGSNYREWFTIVRIILHGIGLVGHVNGTSPQPSTPDASCTLADHYTMAHICQSYEIDIHTEIGNLLSIHAMWKHLGYMFEHSISGSQYTILHEITYVQQCEHCVRENVSNLWFLWHQIDFLVESTLLTCKCYTTHSQSHQTQRTIEFLIHIYLNFEAVHSKLLNWDALQHLMMSFIVLLLRRPVSTHYLLDLSK